LGVSVEDTKVKVRGPSKRFVIKVAWGKLATLDRVCHETRTPRNRAINEGITLWLLNQANGGDKLKLIIFDVMAEVDRALIRLAGAKR